VPARTNSRPRPLRPRPPLLYQFPARRAPSRFDQIRAVSRHEAPATHGFVRRRPVASFRPRPWPRSANQPLSSPPPSGPNDHRKPLTINHFLAPSAFARAGKKDEPNVPSPSTGTTPTPQPSPPRRTQSSLIMTRPAREKIEANRLRQAFHPDEASDLGDFPRSQDKPNPLRPAIPRMRRPRRTQRPSIPSSIVNGLRRE
jgi:hypothetical protein